MYAFLTILIIVISILLMAVVLVQNPKGGGVGGAFGGVSQQILGARRSSDIIEKLTWGFAGALLLLSVMTAFFVDKSGMTNTQQIQKSVIEEQQMKTGFTGTVPTAPATTPAAGNNAQPQNQGTQPAAPAQ